MTIIIIESNNRQELGHTGQETFHSLYTLSAGNTNFTLL